MVIKYAATYDLGALERHVKGEDTHGLEAEEEAAGGLRAALQVRGVVGRSEVAERGGAATSCIACCVCRTAAGSALSEFAACAADRRERSK